jgi:hypothetical protein
MANLLMMVILSSNPAKHAFVHSVWLIQPVSWILSSSVAQETEDGIIHEAVEQKVPLSGLV